MQLQHQDRRGLTLRKWAVRATALLAIPAAMAAFDSGRVEASPAIKWQPSMSAALKEAKRTGKPIFADFYATWCKPCHYLDKAYVSPAIVKESQKWVMVKIDVDKSKSDAVKYRAESLPTMLFLDRNGKEKGRKVGFAVSNDVKTEAQLIKVIAKDVEKSMVWTRKNKI
jgi:thioredoxin 1